MSNASIPAAPGLADHFALIIGGLCRAVAARAPGNPAASALLVLLWGRLQRMVVRFARIVEQAAAGGVPVQRVRSARTGRAPRRDQRWPSGTAWLVRLVPEAACYGSQLQHLLAQPEMAALLAAAPQAGRMLGPLRQMLAVQARSRPQRPPQRRAAAPAPAWMPPAVSAGPAEDSPVSGFLPSGVPYWARHAWPGHDFAGREPPRRAPAAVPEATRTPPARERSG